MRTDSPSLLAIIIRLFQWFISPRRLPEDQLGQKQARLFTFYIFASTIATILNFLIWQLVDKISPLTLFGVVVSFAAYIGARFYDYKPIVIGTILTLLAYPYVLSLLAVSELNALNIVFVCTLALLISTQFLSFRANLQISILVLLTVIFLVSSINPDSSTPVLGILVPTLLLILLLLLNAYQREYLAQVSYEKDNTLHPAFLQSAIKLIPDAAIIQTDKSIVAANEAALRLFDAPDLIGQPITNFIDTHTSNNYQMDAEASQLTIRYDDILNLSDEHVKGVHIIARNISYKDDIATLMLLRPNQQAERIKLLEELVSVSTSALLVTDTDLDGGPQILMVNKAFCEMTGYKKSELIGRTPRILQGPKTERPILDALRHALENDTEEFRGITTNYRKDNSLYKVSWVIRAIKNDKGKITHYISAQDDVSHLYQDNQLANNESIFRQVSELVSDYAYALAIEEDKAPQFVWLTGAVQETIGLGDADILNMKRWDSLIHQEDLARYQARFEALLSGENSTIEYKIKHRDGTIRWVRDTAYPLFNEQTKELERILATVHDISEHITMQKTLKEHVIQQAVAAELGLLALNTTDNLQLIEYGAVLCSQVLNISEAVIHEYHPAPKQLSCVGGSNIGVHFNIGDTISADANQSLAGFALAAKEATISRNLLQDERFSPVTAITKAGYRSALAVIVHGTQQPYGILTVYSDAAHNFTYDEIHFVQSISNVISTFVERNRAQTSEREQTEFAEALRDATAMINARLALSDVLEKIMSYLRQTIPQAEFITLLLEDPETNLYKYETAWGAPSNIEHPRAGLLYNADDYGLFKQMIDTQQPVNVPDTAKNDKWIIENEDLVSVSYLAAPIVVEDHCIGFINLISLQLAAFDDDDAIRLHTFADKTGTAIVNARRQEDLERRVIERTAELNREREQLAAVFAGTGDGIIYTENGEIILVNQSLCDLTGFARSDLLSQSVKMITPENITAAEVKHLENIIPTIKAGEVWRGECPIARKDGSRFTAALTISRIRSIQDNTLRAVTMVRDISRERALDDFKKRFIATAAHELRSPIASMKTRMYMMKRQPDNFEHHFQRLDYTVERLNYLISDLLDVSSFEEGRIILRKQNIILQDVLDNVVDTFTPQAEEKGLTLQYMTDDTPILILADAHRLEQVFVNLVNNAILYTDEGFVQVHCLADSSEDSVIIKVKDTGRGIPKEEIPYIFQPFFRAKDNNQKGSGLGLNIAKEIVELHGGTIELESEVGVGTTFTVRLPMLPLTE